MEIGLFQLENLVLTRTQFGLLDLRQVPAVTSVRPIDMILKAAVAVTPAQVVNYIQTQKWIKEYPVVLLCESGQVSSQIARQLEATGYSNIYVVAGGAEGLLSEV